MFLDMFLLFLRLGISFISPYKDHSWHMIHVLTDSRWLRLTFLSLLSSIGELAVPGVTSPSKKPSLVISSWVEREEPSWGSTWKSGGDAQTD